MLVPITAKWFLVVSCDKDEWKIMVGNMKNDVGILDVYQKSGRSQYYSSFAFAAATLYM